MAIQTKDQLQEEVEEGTPPDLSTRSHQTSVADIIIGFGKVDWEFRDDVSKASKLFWDEFKASIDDGSADIYWVTSVLRCVRYHGLAERSHWLRSILIWKCLLCAFIQMWVTPMVAATQIYNLTYRDDGIFCKMEWDFETCIGKIVATAFSWYIWILYIKEQNNTNDPSNPFSYLIFDQNKIPLFVDGTIFLWGWCVNVSVQFITSISAILVIYTAEDPLNVVMNSLAIFFINELDDVLPTKAEYKRAKRMLAAVESEDDEVQQSLRSLIETEASPEGSTDGEVGTTRFYTKAELLEVRPIKKSFVPFKWNGMVWSVITFLVLSLAPFFMFTCYRLKPDS